VNLAATVLIAASILAQNPAAPPAAGPPAAAPAAPAATAPANALEVSSALDFVLKGGWPMVPIGICSLVAMAIIIERAMVLRRGRVVPRGFVNRLNEVAHDRAKAMELCRQNRSPIARILGEAVKRQGEPQDRLEKHVEDVGGRELVALRHHMRVLSALPQVATMLGLLGTVFGMIKTFQAVAATSEALGKTEMLAKGIFEAWTCTAGGLFVAIPVMIAFHWLMGKIDTITADVDRTASEFIERQKALAASSSRLADSPRIAPAPQSDGVAGAAAVASA
jgi:biopolymer transport protein ExbB